MESKEQFWSERRFYLRRVLEDLGAYISGYFGNGGISIILPPKDTDLVLRAVDKLGLVTVDSYRFPPGTELHGYMFPDNYHHCLSLQIPRFGL